MVDVREHELSRPLALLEHGIHIVLHDVTHAVTALWPHELDEICGVHMDRLPFKTVRDLLAREKEKSAGLFEEQPVLLERPELHEVGAAFFFFRHPVREALLVRGEDLAAAS